MEWRKTLAACLPPPLKRTIKRLVCGTLAATAPPAAPTANGPRAALALAPGRSIEIVPGDIISDAIAATGLWEEELSSRLVALARSLGGTMVEVGANIVIFRCSGRPRGAPAACWPSNLPGAISACCIAMSQSMS